LIEPGGTLRKTTGFRRVIKWLAMTSLLTLMLPVMSKAQPDDHYVRTSTYVPVRDGTLLAMNIYRPAVNGIPVAGPAPVIFMFTPYRARYRDVNGDIRSLSQVRSLGLERLIESGYVIAEADIRGKGASFGARRGFQDRTEANDGYDLVQWLAQQPFSSGVVGMMGCSYLGGSTLHVASTMPPALKAIFVGASDIDKFDFVRRGGITAQFNTRPDEPLSDDLMSIPMDEDSDGSMLQAAVAQHAGNTPMAPLWYSMPFRDSVSPLTGNRFWEEVGPYPYLQALKSSGIATYFWGNLKDEPTSQVILAAANLGSKLLIGPGSHCIAPPDYDLGNEIQRYFDHYLKGMDNGFEKEPRNTWWVENAAQGQQWLRSDQLPGSQANRRVWYLGIDATQSTGVLDELPQTASSQFFTVDYSVESSEYFSFWVEPQSAHGLSYTTDALEQDLHLEGYPVVEVKLSVDKTDVNVFAYLEEVDAAGVASVLAMGRLAAGYRATGAAPYDVLGLPFHPGREVDYLPLVPGEEVALEIALLPVSRIVMRGHRLRLSITGADPRQRNLAEIRQSPPPTLNLLLGGQNAARLLVPVRE